MTLQFLTHQKKLHHILWQHKKIHITENNDGCVLFVEVKEENMSQFNIVQNAKIL